jgi:hypothetical protein
MATVDADMVRPPNSRPYTKISWTPSIPNSQISLYAPFSWGILAENLWVVAKSVHPSWCTLQVPSDTADMLGIPLGEAPSIAKNLRVLYFFARGPGIVRVLSLQQGAKLLAKEVEKHRFLAQVTPSEKLIFTLPDEVETHLGIEVFSRGRPGVTGTDDALAWSVPGEEWYAYRLAERTGKNYSPPPEGAHVYLIRNLIHNLLPTVEVLEGDGPAPKRQLVGFASPPRRI